MSVVLLILKIIGIVLLCIIGTVLLLLCLILFVPVRYRIRADKAADSDDFSVRAGVSYLLHMISAGIIYDKEGSYYIKVFGIRIRPKKEKVYKVNKDSGHMTEVSLPETDADSDSDTSDADIKEPDYVIDWNEEEKPDDTSSEDTSSEDTSSAETGSIDEENKKLFDKISGVIEKIVDKFESLSEKYDSIKKEARFWEKMIKDERNQNAAALVKTTAVKAVKKIIPKKIKGYIHFGFDDPALTGRILMYLSIMYPVLPRRLIIDPSFTDTDIYGNIDAKGHFALVYFAVYFIKVYFNKDVKRTRRIYKKHKDR